MNRNVRLERTLVYYDGIQLFVGCDQFSQKYICLLAENLSEYDRYICIPVSTDKLGRFCSGKLDLRSMFVNPELEEWFECKISDFGNHQHPISMLNRSDIAEHMLPETGFFLSPEPVSDSDLVREAVEKNKGIMRFSIDAPEAQYEPRIEANHLIEALSVFQSLVKFAYMAVNKGLKAELEKIENYLLEVYGFSSGSFKVHLQTKAMVDLFGSAPINKAMGVIEKFVTSANDKEEFISIARSYRGHCVRTYMKLLNSVVKNNSPIKLQWADAISTNAIERTITRVQAETNLDWLNKVEDLGVEKLDIVGHVIKADNDLGTWKIRPVDENKVYSGVIKNRNSLSLEGIVIKTQVYKFSCEEKIEEILGSGVEKRKLYLLDYHMVNDGDCQN